MMNAEDRQQDILARLRRDGRVGIADLSDRYGVSEMTVRRDLADLVDAGLAVRVHGGATSAASSSFEPPFALRARANAAAKERIAVAVAGRVKDGQTLILDGGTTGLGVARQLAGRNVTVCALNLKVAEVLAANPVTRVMVPGGSVRAGESSIVGQAAYDFLHGYRFDLYIMTVSAVSVSAGLTEWNTQDAAVKRAALHAARRCAAAVDSSKFGQEAFARICGLEDVDVIVSDDAVTSDTRAALTAAGPDLLIA